MSSLENNIFSIKVALFFDDGCKFKALKLATEIQEIYSVMFPDDPQIFQLPDDAPPEIPRCIFSKSNGSATLTFNNVRLDFNGIIKDGSLWRDNMGNILNSLVYICNKINIKLKRVGLIIETKMDGGIDELLQQYISINEFNESEEKTISWVSKRKAEDVNINVVVCLQKFLPVSELKNKIIVDVNTDINKATDGNKILDISDKLLNIIGEKMKDVICG